MKIGMRSPARVDALYGSEVKFGYDKNICTRSYRYRVDGDLLTFREIYERLPNVPEKLLKTRLARGQYNNTLAELGRPTKTQTARGAANNIAAGHRFAAARNYQRQMGIERRARREAEREGHKPI